MDAAALAQTASAQIGERRMKLVTCEAHYELRFAGLLHQARKCAFPCDADGHVDIDKLSLCDRANYFYARTVIGREFLAPVVGRIDHKLLGRELQD